MDMPEIPEWMLNIGMHAVSGFLVGFSATFVANPAPELPDLGTAIYGAAVIGLYGAVKEVAAYVESLVKKKDTKAGGLKSQPAKTLKSRML